MTIKDLINNEIKKWNHFSLAACLHLHIIHTSIMFHLLFPCIFRFLFSIRIFFCHFFDRYKGGKGNKLLHNKFFLQILKFHRFDIKIIFQ